MSQTTPPKDRPTLSRKQRAAIEAAEHARRVRMQWAAVTAVVLLIALAILMLGGDGPTGAPIGRPGHG